MATWYPIQVKLHDRVGRSDIDTFEGTVMREDHSKGFILAFDFTSDALRQIDVWFRWTERAIVALTVREILDEQFAKKLA